ncbi:MAG: hypothetical protein ACD_74C00069G0008 [uncultured bacterium]|nr:MAG: hypothetical protein ACD_74C00069G0008 [uncultured bacterium]
MSNLNNSGPPKGCVSSDTGFQVGDKVTFTNDNGAVFPGKTIVGSEIVNGEKRFFYAPTASPWFSARVRNLKREK